MRVAVLIKQVPDTDRVRMDEDTGTLIRDGAGTVPNLLDLHALSALRIWFPDHPGLHVTAFSMGPASAELSLREAMALGAHEAVLLCDRAFAGADTWATALTLEAALRQLGPFDLVLCGEKATDGETGQVGPELAVLLEVPFATRVSEASFGDGRVRVTRLIEHGSEQVDLPLPCLLTVTAAIAPQALPSLAGKMAARRARISRLDSAALGLDPASVGLLGSPTRVVRLERPVLRRDTQMFSPDRSTAGIDSFLGICARFGLVPGPSESP